MRQHAPAQHSPYLQALVGVGVLLLALGLALGAWLIPSDAGYAGVGFNFLPWVVSTALGLCGLLLIRKARRGGFLHMDDHRGEHPNWAGFAWMSAGMLLNAAWITALALFSVARFVLCVPPVGCAMPRPARKRGPEAG